jgi:hypothetical protein
MHRGRGSCSNTAGIPVEALDYAVQVKLQDMLNSDFDRVLDLCQEQAQVWRERQAIPRDQRAPLEREQKRLGGAINRFLDQIEAGQAIGDRLKKRQEELDIIKDKLAQADVPELSRDMLADSLRPLDPLVALGEGDPVAIRQTLRKIGVTAIGVTPDRNGWKFEGQADFRGAVHPRTHEGPPMPPALGSVAVWP